MKEWQVVLLVYGSCFLLGVAVILLTAWMVRDSFKDDK